MNCINRRINGSIAIGYLLHDCYGLFVARRMFVGFCYVTMLGQFGLLNFSLLDCIRVASVCKPSTNKINGCLGAWTERRLPEAKNRGLNIANRGNHERLCFGCLKNGIHHPLMQNR